MSADFFNGKRIKRIACGVAASFTLGAVVLSARVMQTKTVEIGQNYYFLVSDGTHIQASAEFARLDGGAGYLLQYDGEDYVALSVYLDEQDGQTVQKSLAETGEKTKLLRVGVQTLYFQTKKEKKNANMYIGAFDCLQGCMSVLEECISRLEKGLTQEKCKRILSDLKKQFSFLSKDYGVQYAAFGSLCDDTAKRLETLLSDTVYAKDLRYLLCELVEKSVALASAFSV
ncbi:MAG: hypothetical protein IJZ32_02665 [Clostridia bacterium]|nr:hypothetical protein [Clostridia bacterium]